MNTTKKIFRYVLLLALLVSLLLIGAYNKAVYAFFDRLFADGGLLHIFQASQTKVDRSITMRSWPTMLSFGLLYTGISVLFLHVYFKNWQKTKIVVGLYGIVFMLCALLMGIGKAANLLQANQLSRHLIELIVSPFPIVLLIPALSFLTFGKKPAIQ